MPSGKVAGRERNYDLEEIKQFLYFMSGELLRLMLQKVRLFGLIEEVKVLLIEKTKKFCFRAKV